MKIGVLYYNDTGKFLYRQDLPYTWIKRNHPEHTIKFYRSPEMNDRFATQFVNENDVIVLSGVLTDMPKAFPVILKGAREQGRIAIYDIDDLDWEIPIENPVYQLFKEKGVEEATKECMRSASVVTVPTRRIAKYAKEITPNVEIFPNAIDYNNFLWNLPKKDDGWIRVAWIGGSSHFSDIQLIEGLGRWVIDSFPNTKFILGGYDNRVVGPVIDGIRWLSWEYGDKNVWTRYIKLLFGEGYDKSRVEILPTKTVRTYPILYKDVDIALAPLINTKFCQSKSELKAIEASARKAAIITSDVGPYHDVIISSINGFTVNSVPEWKNRITELIENAELRKRLGEHLYNDFRKVYSIEVQAEARLEMINRLRKQTILNKKEFEYKLGRFATKKTFR